jgi:glycosyltransferase involved in cell wall biosynthesis
MNDVSGSYVYPPQVRFEVSEKHLPDYQLAADFLNVNRVNVVCLQHEYGIFGGAHGSHILTLMRHLRMPIVTTLHTVLAHPEPGQRAVLEEIADLSERLVVMSGKAEGMLQSAYGIPAEKIAMIPHGIPDMPFIDANFYKDQFGVEGRRVLLTFGLLSPDKGVEVVLDALPQMIRQHPDIIYIILGATHPHIQREHGEAYRLSLQRRAKELGVAAHVMFYNRFVELDELCEFLAMADLYITPYLKPEQIVSGTLSYAMGMGKATISTPYWYAEEMLAEGRGQLVPFRDPQALARQVITLLDNDVERHAMRKRAYTFCRHMIWKDVARRYLDIFAEVETGFQWRPRSTSIKTSAPLTPLEMPKLKFDHLLRLTDDVGVLQHARGIVPNRTHGYCTDDNARALIAVLMAQDLDANDRELLELGCRYLSFLRHAFNEKEGRFRNFMGYDRHWLEEVGSEDSHGRAVWSLGLVVGSEKPTVLDDVALELFEQAVPAMKTFESPRAWAFALVGIDAYLRRFSGDSEVRRLRQLLANRLFDLYQHHARAEWPWIEDTVTYANGKIVQALLLSGHALRRSDMVDAGLHALAWLIREQTNRDGFFSPIGNQGWFSRQGTKARFDQQPIEAFTMIEVCLEAHRLTKDERWRYAARGCFEWFLGRNDMQVSVYDYKSGGCCDGLNAHGVNANQGAESTLAWLISLLHIYTHLGSKRDFIKPERV